MDTARKLAVDMSFNTPESQQEAAEIFMKLYKLFIETDATLVEINPLAEDNGGRGELSIIGCSLVDILYWSIADLVFKSHLVLCMDCKMNFDDNAEKKQPEIFALRDWSQMDERDVRAAAADLNYIGLDGSIGCLGKLDVLEVSSGIPCSISR